MMKFSFWGLVILLSCYTLNSYSQPPENSSFADMISADSLKNIVYALSSDEMGGRKAGSPGEAMAKSYIIQQFERSNLRFLKKGYLQPFAASLTGESDKEFDVGIMLTINREHYEDGKDFYIPPEHNSQPSLKISEIIFLPADFFELQHNKSFVKGKAVVLLPGLTLEKDSSIKIVILNYYEAVKQGAAAVLVPSLQFFENPRYDVIPDFMDLYCSIPKEQRKIPLISISWRIVESLVGKSKMPKLFQDIQNRNLEHYDFPKGKLKLIWKNVTFRSRLDNILGLIPGKQIDNLLVIGAHFDHVGVSNNEIYHGADDNASGVAGLLEMARCFAVANKAGYIPQRTIVFVAFSAEESGLLGSSAFVRSITSKDSVYAMLNMDMIGRREFWNERQDRMFVLGYDQNTSKWNKILNKVKQQVPDLGLNFEFDSHHDPELFLQRSDQFPFLREGIPALFFFDNMKTDYHKPSDTPEKIDYPLLEKRVRFIFLTAWQLAYGENPKFRKY